MYIIILNFKGGSKLQKVHYFALFSFSLLWQILTTTELAMLHFTADSLSLSLTRTHTHTHTHTHRISMCDFAVGLTDTNNNKESIAVAMCFEVEFHVKRASGDRI